MHRKAHSNMAHKLEVRNLRISFRTNNGTVKAVRDIDFTLDQGQTLAIVGESGSGKSVTARAIMGILAGNAIVEAGEIFYDGMDLLKLSEEEFHLLRGNRVAMIFQDPMSSLNPVMTIGKQLTEAMILNGKAAQKDAKQEYKNKTALLREAMKAASGAEPAGMDAFLKSMENGSKLAKGYDEARENLLHARSEAANLQILLLGKDCDAVQTSARELKEYCQKSRHEFLIPESDAAFNAQAEAMAQAGAACKDESGKAAAEQALAPLKAALDAAALLEQPDFFTLAYYQSTGKALPEYQNIAQLNELLNQEAESAFFGSFRKDAAAAIAWSAEKSRAAKQAFLSGTEDFSGIFDQGDCSPSLLKSEQERITKLVEASIDRLSIHKDSLAYTLPSGLAAAIEKYLDGLKLLKKYGEAKGKKKDKAENVDLPLLRENILLLIRRVREAYAAELGSGAAPDREAEAAALVRHIQSQCLKMVHTVTPAEARRRALELMEEVGIPDPQRRFKQYPFEFSGGMRQRIVIAIALSANPDILICDEPTTALDVTIQSQILELITRLKEQRNLSIIFITHDLGVVANMADSIAVMYAGKIVETGTAEEVFYDPRHPYTWALLAAMPDLDTKDTLDAIPGTPPNMIFPPVGDAFAERNKYALEIDFERQPPMFDITETHKAATWLLHPDAPKVAPPKTVTDRIARMKKLEEGHHD